MHEQTETEPRPRGRGRALRWMARILFVVLGLMMGLVVASDPRVTGAARAVLADIRGEGEVVSRQDTTLAVPALPSIIERVWDGNETAAGEAQTEAQSATETPRVSTMPESRVNVIRLNP